MGVTWGVSDSVKNLWELLGMSLSDCEELVGVLTGDDGAGFRGVIFL